MVAAATEHFLSAFMFGQGGWQIDNNTQTLFITMVHKFRIYGRSLCGLGEQMSR